MRPLVGIAACALALVAYPQLVHGDPLAGGAQCEAAFDHAVQLAEHGELVKAHHELASCEAATCDEATRHRCMQRDELIAADTPTLVLAITDDDGAPLADVRVSLDRRLLTTKIDGRAIPVDPGTHELTVYKGGAMLARKKLLILQGQRNRVIAVEAHAQRPSHPVSAAPADTGTALRMTRTATPRRGSYIPSYLTLGVGVTGIGAAALLTKWGRDDNARLAQCSPGCPQASVDHIHRLYLASDVSLGVGIAAIAAGTWLAWRTHAHHALTIQPTASGAIATLSGAL